IDPNETGVPPAGARGGSGAGGTPVVVRYAAEEQVVHDMTLVQSLALETGQGAERGPGRETAVLPGVLEVGVRGQHLQHVLGVRQDRKSTRLNSSHVKIS